MRVLAATALAVVLSVPRTALAETARPADALVDSIGMNVHLSYTRGPYVARYPEVRDALLRLGVRHVRDNAIHAQHWLDRLDELGRDGIKTIAVFAVNDTPDFIRSFPARIPDAFEGFEAPNEFDEHKDIDWSSAVAAFTRLLYTTVKSDPAIAKYPVIGPSLARGARSYATLGDLSSVLDYGNVHDYFGGHEPENRGYGPTPGYGSIDYALRLAALESGSKRVMATETGFCNWPVARQGGVPEDVAGVYEPRLFLAQFARGIYRTYQYELIDEGGADGLYSHCGLLRNDLTPKPAYTALRGLIGLLADRGPAFAPSALDYSLGGDTAHVEHVLLEKRDGTMELALWDDRSLFDSDAMQHRGLAPSHVDLQLERPASGVRVSRFATDGTVTTRAAASGRTIPLELDEHVTIVAIPPR